MAINYKKELENAARSMILVHEPDTLIKMIVRRVVQKVKVRHAGILLRDKEKDTYILTISRGAAGVKIPAGFARMDADNPLISLFRQQIDQKLFNNDRAIVYEKVKSSLKKNFRSGIKQLLKGVLYQMEMFEAYVCIPSYFRNDLLGILLLGSKNNGKRFAQDELSFFAAIASDVAMAVRNAQLFHELELQLEREHKLFINTTLALVAAIDAKDHYTHGHTGRVTALSLEIANKLILKNKREFDKKFIEDLHIASLLHDIGKIGIPESILNKAGCLNDEERKKIQEHSIVGATILQPIKELEGAILGVKYHHERYDGLGYPEGLKEEGIPVIASIISVADTFDAMTTDRPYRPGLSKNEAITQIQQESGKQFNPQVVSALVELFQENKI